MWRRGPGAPDIHHPHTQGVHTPSLLQAWASQEKMRNSTAPPLHLTSQQNIYYFKKSFLKKKREKRVSLLLSPDRSGPW